MISVPLFCWEWKEKWRKECLWTFNLKYDVLKRICWKIYFPWMAVRPEKRSDLFRRHKAEKENAFLSGFSTNLCVINRVWPSGENKYEPKSNIKHLTRDDVRYKSRSIPFSFRELPGFRQTFIISHQTFWKL